MNTSQEHEDTDLEEYFPKPNWADREIIVNWWSKPDLMRIYVGDQISFHDLYFEEVQALVDDLTWKSVQDYHPPVRTAPDYVGSYFCWFDRCRPGDTITGDYGSDGDMWTICCRGAYINLSEHEADCLVSQFESLKAELVGSPVEWQKTGF